MFPLNFIINAIDNEGGPAGFYGFMGVCCALTFANWGAAYGTAKSGVGICTMGILKPDKIIKAVRMKLLFFIIRSSQLLWLVFSEFMD